ncbi:DUF4190 domain-containing protein [Corynebacterium sp. S7]
MSNQISEHQYSSAPEGFDAPQKKEKNVVGIIALICAIVGFIFACVPGALIIGWILLPISFILGIVGLFMKGKPKGTAIGAIIVSIIGTIVGVFVFIGVVGQSFDEAFNEDVSVSENTSNGSSSLDSNGESAASAAVGFADTSAEAGASRENPLPLGSTIESDEWSVTVNSVDLNATDAVMAENPYNDAPEEGSSYILVNITATYKGSNPQGEYPWTTVKYVTPEGTTINSYDTFAVVPEEFDDVSTLYSGGSTTGNEAFVVNTATAADGVLAVDVDMFSDTKFFAVQ